jgi:hypothetical protein
MNLSVRKRSSGSKTCDPRELLITWWGREGKGRGGESG